MYKEFEHISWNDIKGRLKEKFPFLTNADLTWRNSTNEDLLDIISIKLGLSNKELNEVLKNS